ncbi:MAG TPA: hypothetical protein VFS40_03710 [Gemmatimonadales bacterium]|nr:hypothetical protein [Gemmatimonadales bacterium]
MTALFHAHSGLRYLVLLAGVLALLVLVYGRATGRPMRAGRVLTSVFAGLLDLQILLGIALVISGIYYGALMGHMAMMLLAAVVVHVASVVARHATDERRALTLRLGGVVIALLCILLGILAIGRSILGTGAPTPLG